MRKVIIITDMKQVREPYISTTPENKKDVVLGPVPDLGCRITSIKAYLLTDEPVNNLKKVEEGKYLIKELTIDEYLNHRYIRKLIRQYENKPNLWERIFGF